MVTSTAIKKTNDKTQGETNRDKQTLLLQIESLQAQLEEKTSLANDQINSLLEDRKVQMEEFEAYREREYQKINNLTEQLNKTQALLYESTKDFLALKYDSRLKERKWMNERDSIMREMDYLKEQIDLNKADLELQVFIKKHLQMFNHVFVFPAERKLFKVDYGNIGLSTAKCSKLAIKTPEQCPVVLFWYLYCLL